MRPIADKHEFAAAAFVRVGMMALIFIAAIGVHAAGIDDGLDGPRSVEISSDGSRLVLTGDVGSVLALYRRDPDNGVLKRIQAEVDGERSGDALAGVRIGQAVPPNGWCVRHRLSLLPKCKNEAVVMHLSLIHI